MAKKNINLCITPTDLYNPEVKVEKQQIAILKSLENKDKTDIDIQIRHSYPPMWRYPVSDKTKIIYIQPWEYSKIPFEWQYKWETFADAVITPSMWTADKYIEAGLDPRKLHVIPNGYNNEIFNLEQETSKFFDSKKFTFLFVGNHQYRKGLDILLNIWKDTFVRADNVQLFIKDSPQIYGQNNLLSKILQLQYHTDCGKIIYNGDSLSEQEMANIYKNARVIVQPYRGEGYGMHIQEAVACGAYPIITDKGPTEEFIPREIGVRINTNIGSFNITDPAVFALKPGDSATNMGGHAWVLEPDSENLKFNLRLIYQHHERKRLLDHVKQYQNPNIWSSVAEKYLTAIIGTYENGKLPKRLS